MSMHTDHTTPDHTDHAGHPTAATDRRAVVERQKQRFGGLKPGAAFFGWLSAVGLTVLLSTFVVATGVTINLVADGSDSGEIGWDGVVLVVAVVAVSFLAGGYVAGRMARFDGALQGLGVFGWTVAMTVVLAVLGALAGAKFNVLDQIDGYPQLPSDLGELTLQAGVAVVGVVIASLAGSVLGGLAGMHYHRRIDIAGLGR
ncbi:hypothetical protein [Nocardioides sp.]|uniref:hypothetical protein n=1 Tax=Nocardioides sp. TaxID=35761 RepID=UPI003514101F